MASEVYINPASLRLDREELLIMCNAGALVQLDSVVLELDLTAFAVAHDAETHSDVGVVHVQLELIIVVLQVVLHEDAGDTQFLQGLVEVGAHVGTDGLLNSLHQEVILRDIVGLVRHLRCLTVKPER